MCISLTDLMEIREDVGRAFRHIVLEGNAADGAIVLVHDAKNRNKAKY